MGGAGGCGGVKIQTTELEQQFKILMENITGIRRS